MASLKQPPAEREPIEKIYNVEVFDVEPANLQEIISGFGTARADREVTLAAEVAGSIESVHLHLKVGREVHPQRIRLDKNGRSETLPADVLLQIDPKTYQQRVEQSQKRIAEATAELRQLEQEKKNLTLESGKAKADVIEYRREFQRILQLQQDGVLVESDVTKSRLELQRYELLFTRAENRVKLLPFREKQINARIETYQTDLRMAELDLERTIVIPPFSGTLSEVTAEKGQYVRPGDPLVRITDKTFVEIAVPITLEDFAKIEPKLRQEESNFVRKPLAALAENESDPPRWVGRVVRASPIADELTRTVNIFIRVDNRSPPNITEEISTKNRKPWSPLLPGSFVHARIDGPILEQILVVPRDAIVNGRVFVAVAMNKQMADDSGNRPDSFVGKDIQSQQEEILLVEERAVTVKRTLHSFAVVSHGLKPGDRVILTNLDIIHPNAKIRVRSHRKLADELQPRKARIIQNSLAGGGSNADQKKVN
ncbi:MAG: HlyD family efflux transporter periplasmic adaptor subunit [Planctomycetes bacterium]|nr:HlyD family efflux transporter periplasmic adaptor subunit [Planctomycetota bacterium]